MKNSNTVFPGKIPAGAVFDDRGLTFAETLPAIIVVTLLLSLLLPLLSGVSVNTARSRETLFFLREFLVFDKTIRDKAGKVIIPYWERTVTVSAFFRGGRDLAGTVLEMPYYGGAREGSLRLSVDGENRLVLESSGGEEEPEYYYAPKALTVKNVEVLHDDEGRPLALKLDFEYRNESFYTLAPFAAFPVKRGFHG
jgi:hypothetical protein